MSAQTDIPEELWNAARELRNAVNWNSNSSVEIIARALKARDERAAPSVPADVAGLVERLKSAHDRFAVLEGVDNDGLCDVLEAADAIDAQSRRIAELEAALEPFANCADQLDGDADVPRAPDGEWAKFRLLTDDYRRARRTLTGGQNAE